MSSRTFLSFAMSLAAGVAVIGNPFRAAAADAGNQYYELRIYTTTSDAQRQRVNDYWQSAAIPAYNRMGIQPVGVFTEQEDSATNNIYVLIPCDSLEIFTAIPAKLAADAEYQKAAADYLSAPKPNPAYDRFESSLLVAFDGMKHISIPPAEWKYASCHQTRRAASFQNGRKPDSVWARKDNRRRLSDIRHRRR